MMEKNTPTSCQDSPLAKSVVDEYVDIVISGNETTDNDNNNEDNEDSDEDEDSDEGEHCNEYEHCDNENCEDDGDNDSEPMKISYGTSL